MSSQTAVASPRASTSVQPEISTGTRLLSLDVFRGATIASMILVNNPGSWSAVYAPFLHADWHGWTFTDLVFPFFLWIVGVSITFSFAKRVERGDDRGRLLAHVAKRSALIFLIGLFLAAVPRFDLSTLRIPGVLQRIAVCYLIAATIFLFTKLRGRILWIVGLLSVYWVLMKYVPVPGYGAGVLEVPGNFSWWVDGLVLQGHMWSQTKTWDPEGIVSTLPSMATALFGILAGEMVRARRSPEERTSWMFLAGNLLLFAGMVLATWMPINKKMWTASFSVFMAGMALVIFACCYWLIDIKKWNRFARPFEIYGMNALAMFVLSGLVAKTLGLVKVPWGDQFISLQAAIYRSVFVPIGPDKFASLAYAIANVLFFWAIAWFMYRRKWFVKL